MKNKLKPSLQIEKFIAEIYGKTVSSAITLQIEEICQKYLPSLAKRSTNEKFTFSEKDILLITYGDSLLSKSLPPLQSLANFLEQHGKDIFSTVHILPFFPYSSDDGFSVIDFKQVNPELGEWKDITLLKKNFKLMFDFVLNHISSKSIWFHEYLKGTKGFENFAHAGDETTDYSKVVRPRDLPLFTTYSKKSGKSVQVWTTFSADQIDINYNDVTTLLRMIDIFLFYVSKGADIFRLDAIAYLWKENNSSCIHLSKVHSFVKLLRAILDHTAPEVIILTETNVPHPENISYFGTNGNEAQMVYNFTLPPLLLYTFHKQDSKLLLDCLDTLNLNSNNTSFLNFTASHDGIGVRPLEGIIAPNEIEALIDIVKKNGGNVSYKINSDGTKAPYELNISYPDALNEKNLSEDLLAKKFLASQALMLSIPGVPAVYIHSLLGSRNWTNGVKITGRYRTINRAKLDTETLNKELTDSSNFRFKIFNSYKHFLNLRKTNPAFSPSAKIETLHVHKQLISFMRTNASDKILVLINISKEEILLPTNSLKLKNNSLFNLITGKEENLKKINFTPYEVKWFIL